MDDKHQLSKNYTQLADATHGWNIRYKYKKRNSPLSYAKNGSKPQIRGCNTLFADWRTPIFFSRRRSGDLRHRSATKTLIFLLRKRIRVSHVKWTYGLTHPRIANFFRVLLSLHSRFACPIRRFKPPIRGSRFLQAKTSFLSAKLIAYLPLAQVIGEKRTAHHFHLSLIPVENGSYFFLHRLSFRIIASTVLMFDTWLLYGLFIQRWENW